MRRRELMLLLAGAMTAARALRAQQEAMPVIGFLGSTSPGGQVALFVAAFLQGLSEIGYVEGQNVTIEWRWAEGYYDRLPALAADLVGHRVDVIVTGTTPAALAARRDLDDPDRLQRWRPSWPGASRQPRPAGRQPHGLQPLPDGTDAQVARAA